MFSHGKQSRGPAGARPLAAFALTLVMGCASAPPPAPVAQDTASEGKLEIATRLHTQLATQLGAVPHEELVHCQTTSGDCLISVAERREEIVNSKYLNACRDPDAEKQGPCVAHALEENHQFTELASYLETENWCSKKLLECTAALASDAAHQAARQRTIERRSQIEAAAQSVAATSLPEFAKEKLAFFADARALGPTFCILSKIIVQDCGDSRQARRYALVSASLHPHGYVLEHCADQMRKASPVERLQDFDDLLAGQKPFDIVHQVMTRVAEGSPNSAAYLIERNLARIRAAIAPHGQVSGLRTPTTPNTWQR